MRFVLLVLLASSVFPSLPRQGPGFEIVPVESSIKFHGKSSTTIAGKFDKWDATLKFASTDETTGALEITIQADCVDTGSGLKNKK